MPDVVQFFDMVVGVPVVQIVHVCVQFLDTVIDMPVVVHVVFLVLKTVEVPQLQYLDKVVDVFFVQFIDGVDVPVIMQRRVVSLTVEVPSSSSSTEWWTFPLCSRDVHPQCKLCRRPTSSQSCDMPVIVSAGS